MNRSNFRDLDAWKQARRLVPIIYRFTEQLPRSERYILVAQMLRAVHSVHLNIAEGSGRLSIGEWQHFLGQARGSLLELASATIAAFDLKYCTVEGASEVTTQTRRVVQLVNGLLRITRRGFAAKKFAPQPANGPRSPVDG
jgi:four helix bundle protein